jgi:hypothetical protein
MGFLFDAAKRRATDLGLTVISVCHADIPPGMPIQDHFGNYVTARTIYIGKPGTAEKNCAYGRSVFPIHQAVDPGIDSCLLNIWEALNILRRFPDLEQYLEAWRPSTSGTNRYEQVRDYWLDCKSIVDRAKRCLPDEILAWLIELR